VVDSHAAATLSRPPRSRIANAAPRIRTTILLAVGLLVCVPCAIAHEPSASVAQALKQLEAKRYSLARSYLDPVVIDPRLSGIQRARAYYVRGYAFMAEGLYVSAAQDYSRALELDPGNATVLAEMARLYADGHGVEKNLDKAFTLFQKAARAGNDIARLYVGYALLTGAGTPPDVNKARYWLREAADAGHVGALVQLARSYRTPLANPPDTERALALYRQAVDKGSVDALVALGYMYVDNEIGEPDVARATEYFRQAAERNAPAGQTALAFLYLADRRYAAARQWFERAVAVEYPDAFAGLGRIYQKGLGVTANRTRALEIYSKGATLGDIQSQLMLAAMQLEAPVTEAGTESALHWLRVAAGRDHPAGHNGLAWLLATTRFDRLRDGEAAVAEALRATVLMRTANTLDTLAAAYAETGDFDRAVATQREAMAIIDVEHGDRRDEFERHLARYLQQKPWRE
jgi:TPR repeat protein